MEKVLITGVSSGIGEALAKLYLQENYVVLGTSRRPPYQLIPYENFRFHRCDLSQPDAIRELMYGPFHDALTQGVEVAFLNAGVSGNVPGRGEDFSVDELNHVISVNVLANKLLIDLLLSARYRPKICVLSASMAGVRFRGGTLPYSLSKAALSALAGVYAAENPDVLFAVLGLCNVDTHLSRQVSFSQRTAEFPELKALQSRALTTGYMVSPRQRANDIYSVINDCEHYGIKSGEFVDIRTVIGGTGMSGASHSTHHPPSTRK
ncbi:SDR family NAD(P)-dependent oxidoreductase [Paraburkholderia sp. FT54]|uniref:SDR family NAD(P)-dependent oxidoreductase n=1 Tax=Paraburkholderia sp. FT54 TaxID=3074437 RepID=UPI0028780518|nr:SDR family NAD(P)-dependent oxidoreductase [Paraburkholderia sp. FT54]WNC88090.1 SDR family NAD(P)-dependent oxidoreductase [Paraburkholderia sp. FT54]